MRQTLARVWRFPFYLWLLGVYPILHLYSENLGLVKDDEVIYALAFALIATTIAFFAINLFIKQRHKSAALLGICSLAFSLSGHLHQVFFRADSLLSWTATVLLLTAMALAHAHKYAAASSYRGATALCNPIISALVILSGVAILSWWSGGTSITAPTSWDGMAFAEREISPKLLDSPDLPDIYYIIPDGYPSDGWLREAMNYDNSAFTEALESRGFIVAPHAQSNYGVTLLSLSSTTNMRYFAENDSDLSDLDFLRLAFADSLVARHLLARGYTYAHYLSGHGIPSPIADISRDFSADGRIDISSSELGFAAETGRASAGLALESAQLSYFYKQSFLSLYYDSTLLGLAASGIASLTPEPAFAPYARWRPERFLDTLADVATIADMPEATFTVVHLLKPHEPIVFDAKGNILIKDSAPTHDKFFAEFGFVNSQFLHLIDAILERSDNPPVIMFQADHGTKYGKLRANGRLTQFDVYAAYHVPDGIELDIPQPYTLVNSFPLVFNAVFGTEHPLIEDRLYEASAGYDAPFEQVDVTAEFAHP